MEFRKKNFIVSHLFYLMIFLKINIRPGLEDAQILSGAHPWARVQKASSRSVYFCEKKT